MQRTDTTELRTEGKNALGLRVGHYCLEAADEIDRLRTALTEIAAIKEIAPFPWDPLNNGPITARRALANE